MRHLPERTCIGCRKVCPASELVRLIAPEGQVRLADHGRGHITMMGAIGKRGRGAWVHPHCFVLALKGGAMSRAFRRQVEVTDRETLLAQMHAACGRSINVQGDSR
jgi:predicted RNA-binding protein YlxR (DUF448 family)